MRHTCQLIMIVSLDIINNNQIRCHSLGFCNVTGTFIYFETIELAIATTLVVNVRVPFNFTTFYTSGYVITYIIKTAGPNHLILILNLANKSYFIMKVSFCHLLAWFKNYNPLKVGVNSFWDTLYISYLQLPLPGLLHATNAPFVLKLTLTGWAVVKDPKNIWSKSAIYVGLSRTYRPQTYPLQYALLKVWGLQACINFFTMASHLHAITAPFTLIGWAVI